MCTWNEEDASALHPQSDGQVKRQHQTILNYLAKFIFENQKNWIIGFPCVC